jgi:hypothetical protein
LPSSSVGTYSDGAQHSVGNRVAWQRSFTMTQVTSGTGGRLNYTSSKLEVLISYLASLPTSRIRTEADRTAIESSSRLRYAE